MHPLIHQLHLRNLFHEVLDINIKMSIHCSTFIKVEKSYMLINIWDAIQKKELGPHILTCEELQDTLYSEKSKFQNNRHSENILISGKLCMGVSAWVYVIA